MHHHHHQHQQKQQQQQPQQLRPQCIKPIAQPAVPTAAQCYTCGCLSAACNVAVTFPLNKIVFRQQLQCLEFRRAAEQVLVSEFATLYRGALPPLLQRGCNLGAMFGVYSAVNQSLSKRYGAGSTDAAASASGRDAIRAISACAAGACEAVFMPFERVQTLLQLQMKQMKLPGCGALATARIGTFGAFAELRRLHGVREWYRGLGAVFLRNTLSTGIYFVLKERAQLALPLATGGCQNSFLLGAALGALLSTIVYPLNVAKSRLQSCIGGAFVSPWLALNVIYAQRGRSLRRLFRGAPANCFRAALSWGVVTASYDYFSLRLYF